MNKFLPLSALLIFMLHGCGGGSDSDNNVSPISLPSGPGFSLSGTVHVADNTAMDSDVNDVNAPFRSNDDRFNPQPLPNPVILGGYVNEVREGSGGSSFSAGDIDDFYEVELLAGQQITLLIGSDNLSRDDIDLGLLDANTGTLLDASVSEGNTENLTVRQDGRYLVQVQAFVGASNYVLLIGQTSNITSQSEVLRLSDDFEPGEVTAQFKPKEGLSIQSVSPILHNLGMQQVAGTTERRMLLRLDNPAPLYQQSLALKTRTPPRFQSLKQQKKYETLLAVKALRRNGQVLNAAPNYRLHALRVPNDRLYPRQWHYPLINLPEAWDITTGSSNVVVAVIDTGIISNHPDLSGRLVQGYDFISDTDVSLDGDGIDNNPEDPGDQSPGGSSFHGTHVAGTIAANSNNDIGVAGVGWQTRIMPLRTLGRAGVGTDYSIEQAMLFAAGLPNDSGQTANPTADIINLSLGGPRISPGFENVIQQVREAGIMIVAAAGNDGDTTVNFPGALEGVLSVAAVDLRKERASYSNFNSTVSLAAPGGSRQDVDGDGAADAVVSTSGDEGFFGGIQATYTGQIGTSMATPHVAGVLALMKAVNPNLTPSDVDSLLTSGQITEDIGASGKDNSFGYGLIDAQKAVQASLTALGRPIPPAPASLSISPGSLNFSSSLSSVGLELRNSGSNSLQVLRIESERTDVLNLTEVSTDSNGLGTYRLTLQRAGQNNGTYQARIRFVSSANTVEIPVLWQIGSAFRGNAGTQYVLLADEFGDSVAQQQVQVSNGQYFYNFNNVPSGTYTLFSGADNNNNDLICEAGESCGAYLTLERPREIILDRSLSGIDFDVGFDTEFLLLGVMQLPLSR